MKRQTLNFLIDALALIGLVFLIATGLFLRYILPPGSGTSLSVWGFTRHEWGDIHFWIAVFIITVVSIHLALHWRWIVCFLQNKPREGSGTRVALGVAGLMILILISAAPFLSPKEKLSSMDNIKENHNNKSSHSENRHNKSTSFETIRGDMTLDEVKQLTGVPVNHILKELGIPENTPASQKLGQMKKKYDFNLEAVHQIIKNYQQ